MKQLNTERERPELTLKEEFEIEKNAKNRAYSFILSRGLFKEFSEWCEATKDIDPFLLCRDFADRMRQIVVRTSGNCMDSPQSPTRIKNGEKVLLREIPLQRLREAVGHYVAIVDKSGKRTIKHLVFEDLGLLSLRCYNPLITVPYLVKYARRVFIVDAIIKDTGEVIRIVPSVPSDVAPLLQSKKGPNRPTFT